MLGAAMPPFFMATTIKVDTVLQTFSWQDDQTLAPMDDVDIFVDGKGGYVPESTSGTGSDAPSTQSAAAGTDTIKAAKAK